VVIILFEDYVKLIGDYYIINRVGGCAGGKVSSLWLICGKH